MSCAKTYFNKMENSLIRNFRFFAWHMAATFNDFLGETYIIDIYPILQCRKKNWQIPKYSLRSKRFCAVQEQRTRNKSQRPREKSLVSFLARSKPKIPFLGLFFCSETKRKRLLRRLTEIPCRKSTKYRDCIYDRSRLREVVSISNVCLSSMYTPLSQLSHCEKT